MADRGFKMEISGVGYSLNLLVFVERSRHLHAYKMCEFEEALAGESRKCGCDVLHVLVCKALSSICHPPKLAEGVIVLTI